VLSRRHQGRRSLGNKSRSRRESGCAGGGRVTTGTGPAISSPQSFRLPVLHSEEKRSDAGPGDTMITTRQRSPQRARQGADRSRRAIGWTLQSLATILLGLFIALLCVVPSATSELPLIPGLLTLAGAIGVTGTVLLVR
jgi:hypothetical protein